MTSAKGIKCKFCNKEISSFQCYCINSRKALMKEEEKEIEKYLKNHKRYLKREKGGAIT